MPVIGEELRTLNISAPIYYNVYSQWNRNFGIISGNADLVSITNFAGHVGLTNHPSELIDPQLIHLASSRKVNTKLTLLDFAPNDGAMRGTNAAKWSYLYLRYQQQGRFTLFFFD